MKPLETNRLILRKYTHDDVAAVNSYSNCDENIIYMLFDAQSIDDTRNFINMTISKAEETPMTDYFYAATLKDTGELIGGCSLHMRGEDVAEIGWIVHRDYWKQGYATEMGQGLLELGFEDLNLHRIVAYCDAENIGSYRIMEKLRMRREGLLQDARPGNKKNKKPYSDMLAYAMLKSDWDTAKEIAYYNSLPVEFNDFIDVPTLSNGEIFLICTEKYTNPEKKHVPSYKFAICKNGEQIGFCDLRIGYGGGEKGDNLYYGGNIGYTIYEKFRGNGYAVEACKLLVPIAHAHKMTKLLITNNVENTASRRVCEKLGAKLLRPARLPEYNDLYKEGQRFSNTFEWSV